MNTGTYRLSRDHYCGTREDKREIPAPEIPLALRDFFTTNFTEKLHETLFSGQAGKDHIYDLKKTLSLQLVALDTTRTNRH